MLLTQVPLVKIVFFSAERPSHGNERKGDGKQNNLWGLTSKILQYQFYIFFKGPLKYLLMPLLGKHQLAITLHMYASIAPILDNTHRGQI